MAAGLGHEIRNPMTTVRGLLQLLSEKEECNKYQEYYGIMIEELDRANTIISEFLSLAKNKPTPKNEVNLNKIITSLHPLLQAEAIEYDKTVKLELGELNSLYLNNNEIRQMILNLVKNGLEAMPVNGLLTIKTYETEDKIFLTVQDQGTGIDANIINNLGTPFITTKDNGTGLGLAICYSIAARHNATISVDSSSMGTTFYVEFNKK
nr:HAMP domain-containing sensor histidine kinase [Desulforamulus aquiferis]